MELQPYFPRRAYELLSSSSIKVARLKTKDERFQSCFVYPARRGALRGAYPYHLDLAHLDVLEKLPKNSTILEISCGGWSDAPIPAFNGTSICRGGSFENANR